MGNNINPGILRFDYSDNFYDGVKKFIRAMTKDTSVIISEEKDRASVNVYIPFICQSVNNVPVLVEVKYKGNSGSRYDLFGGLMPKREAVSLYGCIDDYIEGFVNKEHRIGRDEMLKKEFICHLRYALAAQAKIALGYKGRIVQSKIIE